MRDPILHLPETLAPLPLPAAAPAPVWTPSLVDDAPTLLPGPPVVAPPVAAGFQPAVAASAGWKPAPRAESGRI